MSIVASDAVLHTARAAAPAAEQERRMAPSTAQQLAEDGVFRMLVPTELNGSEVHPQDFFDTLVALAAADGAAGWVSMIGSTTGLLSASLPESWGQEIYANHPNVVSTGVTAPLGKAELVEGGMRISGRWPWGSGSQVSDWISGGAFIMEDGKPKTNKHGQPEPILVFFKADEVTIHDTWYTSGLRGTGSNDIEVTDLFVPEGRWVTLGRRARVETPLYQFPTFGLLALGVSAVGIGIAERALEEFIELAGGKTPTGSTRALAARSSVQKELALAQTGISAAQALTRQSIDEAWQVAQSGDRLSMQHKAKLRMAATNNAWSAVAAVDALYNAAGGTSVFSDHPLQRCFRDVHVVTQHIMVAQPTLETVGKVMLGIDPKTAL